MSLGDGKLRYFYYSTEPAPQELELVAGSNITITPTTSGRRLLLTLASSGGGTSDHAALSHLAWGASGHTGTASRIAAFDGGGAASYLAVGTDVQAYDAGLTSLEAADAAAGLPYVSAANTWTSLALAADKGIYATGAGALATYDLSASGRSLANLTLAATSVVVGTGAGTAGVKAATRGAVLYGAAGPVWDVLPVGSANKVLMSDGTDISWQSISSASLGSILTTRGDILYRDASSPARLPLGTAGQVLGSDGTDAVWQSRGQTIDADDVVSILATSSNTHYARDMRRPTVVRAKQRQIQDAADAKTTPPTLWSVANTARISSASSTSGRLTWQNATGTSATFYNGTATAGYWYRSIGAPLQVPYEWIVRLDASTLQSLHTVAFGITGTTVSSGRRSLAVDIYNNSGTYQLRYTVNDGAAVTVTIDATKASNGCWVRVIVHPMAGVQFWYDITTGGTDYTACTWTHWSPTTSMSSTATGALFATSASWTALMYSDISASNTSTVGVILASERMLTEWDLPAVVPAMGGGYATTGDPIKLIASADFGAAVTPSIARARLRLADAINRLPGDAGTWTFGITGSSSANPSAPTTLQSAAAVILKDAGTDTAASSAYRYWAVYASMASSGNTQAGSIDTASIRLET